MAFATLERNGHFGSGMWSKPRVLRCKTIVAFTTLERNSIFWSRRAENYNSTAEWLRVFFSLPFCTRLSSFFRGARTGRAANGHFRREVWRFFPWGSGSPHFSDGLFHFYVIWGPPRWAKCTKNTKLGTKMCKKHAFSREKKHFRGAAKKQQQKKVRRTTPVHKNALQYTNARAKSWENVRVFTQKRLLKKCSKMKKRRRTELFREIDRYAR